MIITVVNITLPISGNQHIWNHPHRHSLVTLVWICIYLQFWSWWEFHICVLSWLSLYWGQDLMLNVIHIENGWEKHFSFGKLWPSLFLGGEWNRAKTWTDGRQMIPYNSHFLHFHFPWVQLFILYGSFTSLCSEWGLFEIGWERFKSWSWLIYFCVIVVFCLLHVCYLCVTAALFCNVHHYWWGKWLQLVGGFWLMPAINSEAARAARSHRSNRLTSPPKNRIRKQLHDFLAVFFLPPFFLQQYWKSANSFAYSLTNHNFFWWQVRPQNFLQ